MHIDQYMHAYVHIHIPTCVETPATSAPYTDVLPTTRGCCSVVRLIFGVGGVACTHVNLLSYPYLVAMVTVNPYSMGTDS